MTTAELHKAAVDEAQRRRDFAKEQLLITAEVVANSRRRRVPPSDYMLDKVVEDSDALRKAEGAVLAAQESRQAAVDAVEAQRVARGFDLAAGRIQ